jgi:erythromycin esterase
METSLKKAAALIPLIFLAYSAMTSCRQEEQYLTILEDFRNNIIEIPGGSPLEYPDEVFAGFDPLFHRAQVIGLGEGAHGTKEFFELKQRLFRYLVENHQCKALGFEYGFRFQKSLEIEEYITSDRGDLKSIIASLHWIHRNQEFQGLITWMRGYNAGKKKEEMIHFLGIDSQIDIWYQDELKSHIAEVSKKLYELVCDVLSDLAGFGKIDHRSLETEEYQKIQDLLVSLKEKTESYFSMNPDPEEQTERDLLLHNIESHLLSHECRYRLYQNESLRDEHMANHSLWLTKFIGKGAKVAIWAHNAHVAKDPHYAEDGSPAMGKFLKDSLEDSYLVVGTGSTAGKFAAVTEDYMGNDTKPIVWNLKYDPPENSVNHLFCQAGLKNFVLNIAGLSNAGSLYGYLNQERPFFGVGDFYSASEPEIHYSEDRIINLAAAYDIVFYFSDTKPLTIFQEEKIPSR